MALIEPEPQRPHQPQFCTGGHTSSADVTGVLWNVGLVEDDVEEGAGCANDEILNPND
jgi:hypothetical protein